VWTLAVADGAGEERGQDGGVQVRAGATTIAGAATSATIGPPLERGVMDSIRSSMTREEIAALLGTGRLYSPGRDSLYTVDELMDGYESDAPMQSLDARLAAHVQTLGIPPGDVNEAIAQVVHDQGVDQAMRAYVAASVAEGRHVVGVMGGASTPRDAPAYRLAAATAKAVSEAGFLVATGGGLGIMEAGNLGAYFAGRPDDELDAAIDDLKRYPVYLGHEAQYIDSARSITAGQRAGAPSLAVATWRFDLEPISQFSTDIAKLFQNSVREDGLLSIADAGVTYFEGGFGTLREIFQDLVQNSSAEPPCQMGMVFVDTAVYGGRGSPFHLARARAARAVPPFDDLITLADSADTVVAAIVAARGRSDHRMTRAATAGEDDVDP
jgi:predicted Rossmann-fold nucleotide-binding protein